MGILKKSFENIDDPNLSISRRAVLNSKPFLKKIYIEWYSEIASRLPDSKKPVLEIGSGAGFFKEYLKEKKIISSEILSISGIDVVFDACRGIPLKDGSLSAIVMTDVLHHLPDVDVFFKESNRVLANNGRIIMVEPWVTALSEIIYEKIHSEPFHKNTKEWCFLSSGPLSGANIALPWIVFKRDIVKFESDFFPLRLKEKKLLMPVSYLISGGFSRLTFAPGIAYKVVRKIEKIFDFSNSKTAMFAIIDITKDNFNGPKEK